MKAVSYFETPGTNNPVKGIKVSTQHVIQGQRGCGGIAPLILNLISKIYLESTPRSGRFNRRNSAATNYTGGGVNSTVGDGRAWSRDNLLERSDPIEFTEFE